MAAALECWSGRPSTDEDMVEQVLMQTHDRSEAFHRSAEASPACNSSASASSSSSSSSTSSSPPSPTAALPAPKKWQRLGRNFAGAIAALRSSLSINLDSVRDPSPSRFERLFRGGRNLGSHPPEKFFSSARRHFDALPNSYAQAGFDMKDVLLHVRLVEQAMADDHPAINLQEMHDDGGSEGVVFKVTFVCSSPLSWPAMSGSLDTSLICCKKIQIFEKKGLTLGVVTVLVRRGTERQFKSRIDASVKAALKKPKTGGVKLSFGLCGCQEESSRAIEEDAQFEAEDGQSPDGDGLRRAQQLPCPLPISSVVVSIDEWQSFRSGGEELARWVLNSDEVGLLDRAGPTAFRAVYRERRAWVKKLRGCDRGSAYDVEVRQDLLQLMTCGQRNILQFYGIFFEERHGLCVVTRMMDGGSVHDLIQKSRKLPAREVVRIALDVAEGLLFMNNHGVAYRDLNTHKILLDRQRNACLGDMGIVTSCNNAGEITEYETAGYRWLAPEIIAGDPESVSETWMSNVYSYGMALWEMLSGEAAYSSFSPVQAAVGIATCGLRPEVPKDTPQFLKSLMHRCWNSNPTKRPQFAEIISILSRQSGRS